MADTVTTEQTDDDFDTDTSTTGGEGGTTAAEKTFTQADLDRIVADRVTRERSKYKDYNELKAKAKASMSDTDKAISEAEQRGKAAALQATGIRLAKAELRAAAAGKVSPEALDGFLEYADLGRFVDDDGEPDETAIKAAIKKLGGTKPASSTNYDGGARSNADKPADMNTLIRRGAGF